MVYWFLIGDIIHWSVYPIIYWSCFQIYQWLTVSLILIIYYSIILNHNKSITFCSLSTLFNLTFAVREISYNPDSHSV